MTKSIEAQAREYVSNFNEIDIEDVGEFATDIHMFLAGAKARNAQWAAVVNELRESIKHIIKNKNVHPYEYHHYTRDNMISLLSADLTKADQMLKEMGMK